MISLEVNGKRYELDIKPDLPLLWALRGNLKLTGTKYGCGIGVCGCCTVLVDGRAERSCVLAAGDVQDKKVTTIEGLPDDHPIKLAWVSEQVPQCGYCQSGQIMQAVSLIRAKPYPTDEDITREMDGNLCRCGTYPRIRRAIKAATKTKESR